MSSAAAAGGRPENATCIHITALDSIVTVNSLFTAAVFIGLAWNPSDPNSILIRDPSCHASRKTTRDLAIFQIFSFTCFLFSGLVAQTLKEAIKLSGNKHDDHSHSQNHDHNHNHNHNHNQSSSNSVHDHDDGHSPAVVHIHDHHHRRRRLRRIRVYIDKTLLRGGILVSALGTICGGCFMMLGLINAVQIKLGMLGCGSSNYWTYLAVIPLMTLVPAGLSIYIYMVSHAFTQ